MKLMERDKIINFLENTFIDEALLFVEKKRGRTLSEQEREETLVNWHNYSSSFTKMWLNYMTDDKLINVLTKKLENTKNKRSFDTLIGEE